MEGVGFVSFLVVVFPESVVSLPPLSSSLSVVLVDLSVSVDYSVVSVVSVVGAVLSD